MNAIKFDLGFILGVSSSILHQGYYGSGINRQKVERRTRRCGRFVQCGNGFLTNDEIVNGSEVKKRGRKKKVIENEQQELNHALVNVEEEKKITKRRGRKPKSEVTESVESELDDVKVEKKKVSKEKKQNFDEFSPFLDDDDEEGGDRNGSKALFAMSSVVNRKKSTKQKIDPEVQKAMLVGGIYDEIDALEDPDKMKKPSKKKEIQRSFDGIDDDDEFLKTLLEEDENVDEFDEKNQGTLDSVPRFTDFDEEESLESGKKVGQKKNSALDSLLDDIFKEMSQENQDSKAPKRSPKFTKVSPDRKKSGPNRKGAGFNRKWNLEQETKAIVMESRALRESGRAEEAADLIAEKFEGKELSWNSFLFTEWFTVLNQTQQTQKAYELMDFMKKNQVEISGYVISSYLKVVGDSIPFEDVISLLQNSIKNNIEKIDARTYNTCISLAAKRGNFEAAREIFDLMRTDLSVTPDVYSFTSLINACAESRQVEMAEMIYSDMKSFQVEPNVMTKNVLLKAFARVGDTKKLKQYYTELFTSNHTRASYRVALKDSGFESEESDEEGEERVSDEEGGADSFTYATIIDAFAKEGNISQVLVFLKEVAHADDAILCAVLNGCAAARRGELALTIFNDLTGYNAHPYSIPAQAETELKEKLEQEHEVGDAENESSRIEWIVPNVQCYNAAFKALAVSDLVDDAVHFYVRMRLRDHVEPNEITYNILVDMFAKREEVVHAMEVIQQMRRDGIAPSNVTYTSLLNACAESKRPDLADAVIREMKETGEQPDILCWNAALKARAVCGHLWDAKSLFGEIGKAKKDPVKKNVVTYNIMISLYLDKNKLREGLNSMEEMIANGIEPDHVTFTRMFSYLNDEKRGWQALELYRNHRERVMQLANMACYLPLLRSVLFSRNDTRESIKELLDDLNSAGLIPTAAMYRQLVDIFVDEIGNFRDGLRILDGLRTLDRKNQRKRARISSHTSTAAAAATLSVN